MARFSNRDSENIIRSLNEQINAVENDQFSITQLRSIVNNTEKNKQNIPLGIRAFDGLFDSLRNAANQAITRAEEKRFVNFEKDFLEKQQQAGESVLTQLELRQQEGRQQLEQQFETQKTQLETLRRSTRMTLEELFKTKSIQNNAQQDTKSSDNNKKLLGAAVLLGVLSIA